MKRGAVDPNRARLALARKGEVLEVRFYGSWTLESAARPLLNELDRALEEAGLLRTVLDGSAVERWDSRLVVLLARLHARARERGIELALRRFPRGVGKLLALAARGGGETDAAPPPPEGVRPRRSAPPVPVMAVALVGEMVLALGRLLGLRAQMEARDLLYNLRRCSSGALPIVGLVSVLVGVILAFVGANQLSRFGAELYVANLVTIGMAREMGALMAAILMAGRIGAAFAAELAAMRTNEEIDAIESFGLSAVDLLVLPRVLGLVLTLPLLALYADVLGMVGGGLSAVLLFDIHPLQYYEQSLRYLAPSDLFAGLVKAAVFGWIVALSGCFAGLAAPRGALGVGRAATRAVVWALVGIVLADALLTVLYYVLGL